MQNRGVVRQEQMERGLIAEDIRKTAIQLPLPERSFQASIQDEVQERVTAFAADKQQAD
jgi:hypothetical protein